MLGEDDGYDPFAVDIALEVLDREPLVLSAYSSASAIFTRFKERPKGLMDRGDCLGVVDASVPLRLPGYCPSHHGSWSDAVLQLVPLSLAHRLSLWTDPKVSLMLRDCFSFLNEPSNALPYAEWYVEQLSATELEQHGGTPTLANHSVRASAVIELARLHIVSNSTTAARAALDMVRPLLKKRFFMEAGEEWTVWTKERRELIDAVLMERVRVEAQDGRCAQATAVLNKAKAPVRTGRWRANLALAACHERAHMWRESAEYYRKALSIEPEDAQTLEKLASVSRNLFDYLDALAALRKAETILAVKFSPERIRLAGVIWQLYYELASMLCIAVVAGLGCCVFFWGFCCPSFGRRQRALSAPPRSNKSGPKKANARANAKVSQALSIHHRLTLRSCTDSYFPA